MEARTTIEEYGTKRSQKAGKIGTIGEFGTNKGTQEAATRNIEAIKKFKSSRGEEAGKMVTLKEFLEVVMTILITAALRCVAVQYAKKNTTKQYCGKRYGAVARMLVAIFPLQESKKVCARIKLT